MGRTKREFVTSRSHPSHFAPPPPQRKTALAYFSDEYLKSPSKTFLIAGPAMAVKIGLALVTLLIGLTGYALLFELFLRRFDGVLGAFLPWVGASLVMAVEIRLLRKLNEPRGWSSASADHMIGLIGILFLIGWFAFRNSLGGLFVAEKLQWDVPNWGLQVGSVIFAICEFYLVATLLPVKKKRLQVLNFSP